MEIATAPAHGAAEGGRPRRTAILVLGMHRSGTSALTRTLGLLGARLPRQLMAATSHNATGHWESQRVFEAHERLLAALDSRWDDLWPLPEGWIDSPPAQAARVELVSIVREEFDEARLIAIKDPRICRLVPLWTQVLGDLGIEPLFVMPLRHPLEVAESLHARDGMQVERGLLLWLDHVLSAERETRVHRRMLIRYDDLLADQKAAADRLRSALDIDWPNPDADTLAAMAKYLSPDHRNYTLAFDALDARPDIVEWIRTVYGRLAGDAPFSAAALEAYDQVSLTLDVARRAFWPVLKAIEANWHESAEARRMLDALTQERERSAEKVAQLNAEMRHQSAEIRRQSNALAYREAELSALRHQARQMAESWSETIQRRVKIEMMVRSLGLHGATLPLRALSLVFKPARDWVYKLKRSNIRRRQYRIVKYSGLFDAEYYYATYRDLGGRVKDPIRHYVWHGAREGRNPSARFSTSYYSARYPDVRDSGKAPFVHYILHGLSEGREPIDPDLAVLLAWKDAPASLLEFLKAELEPEQGLAVLDQVRRLGVFGTSHGEDSGGSGAGEPESWLREIRELSKSQPYHGSPDVSIIIPVYNQLAFTLACIYSVLSVPSLWNYEIIVADDGSTDSTQEAFREEMSAVRYLRQAHNLGFIRNCNSAAREARGRYLVFLNNDTIVLPRWLDELIGTFEQDSDIGVVGSKMLYPDGRLQEAGGIVWQDGSAWNFGRYDDPRKPEYSYLRDVDYCSGASIAIRRELWVRLNGFDEHFDVAYGEDSDLAFRTRAAGYRTVLQPLSMLLHFEGISSGTDTTQGAKAYQISNARKLAERWRDVLKQHGRKGVRPELEKERSIGRRVLVIDHCTPTPDQDAGSVTCLELMRALQRNGSKVTFIPEDNFLHMPKETRDLQRIGIEAVYAPYYGSVGDYLRRYGSLFDAVILFRMGAASRNLATVRNQCPQAKVMFHVSDLHFLRESRRNKLEGGGVRRGKANEIKARELEVIAAVDLTIVHSWYERDVLATEVPSAKVYVFPWILDVVGRKNEFANRDGVMFLGGFRHRPNIDAALYFIERVWPLIRRSAPDMRFFVVGSEPPQELQAHDGRDNIRVTGYVKDLDEYFEQVRLSVVPMRYGAGIKGKLAMSLAYGVPCVATAVAVEGMGLTQGKEVVVADDPWQLAKEILRLHEDEAGWYRLSENGMDFVRRTYSSETGDRRVREMFDLVGAPVA